MSHRCIERRQRALHVKPGRAARVLLCAAAAIGLLACGDGEVQRAESHLGSVTEAVGLFAGIPQDGNVLGEPSAPVTLTEFADLKCPHCATATLRLLPPVITTYVRAGQVRIVFRNLAFLGPDSVQAARMAAAIGRQGHLYQFLDVFFRTRAEDRTQPINEDLLRRVAAALPGVDVARAMADRQSAAVDQALRDADEEADRYGIRGTPSFLVGRTGEPPRALRLTSMAPEGLTRPIDELLQLARAPGG